MKIFVIAEMANAHEGSLQTAEQIVRAVAETGANAVKFQKYHKFDMADEEWAELVEYARGHRLLILADVFDEAGAILMHRLNVDGYKITSSDMNNIPLIELVASFDKPVILSAGGTTHRELREAIKVCKQERTVLMHGFQAFPTKLEDCELNQIGFLKETYGLTVGYADHIKGDTEFAGILPLIAIGAGAIVIEKHITLNRALQGVDYISSLNPWEFTEMVRDIRIVEKAMDGQVGSFSEAEQKYREYKRNR